MLSRRAALSLLATSSLSLATRPASAEAPAAAAAAGPVFVCVFLRGGADGLNVVIPYTERDYYRLRPTIAVARPGKSGGALDLDGRFALHPRLAPLKAAYDAGELAVVHAVGSFRPTRSHFEAQDTMQTATPADRSTNEGFLARVLRAKPATTRSDIRAVAFADRMPLAFRGYDEALCIQGFQQLRHIGERSFGTAVDEGFAKLYATGDERATRSGKRSLEIAERLRPIAEADHAPENNARYEPRARAFAELARLIKADIGLEAAWLDIGGWDTHKYQGSAERGSLPKRLDELGKALAAFRADLGPRFERIVVLVMTEFGRTAAENGTGGTDHGAASAMLVLGGPVRGGRVYGDLRGLSREALYERRDVAVTTDYRTVFSEIIEAHLGVRDPRRLFPGFAPAAPLGLLGRV